MGDGKVMINRAPVLTLWASIVAEKLGFDGDTAMSLGKAMAGLTAQSKGRHLGIYRPSMGPDGKPARRSGLGEEFWVELCGRNVPAKDTEDGIKAVVKDKPVEPRSVLKYFESKFGDDLVDVRKAMEELADSFDTAELSEKAFQLYERFRPQIPRGTKGWGAKGELSVELIRSLAPGN